MSALLINMVNKKGRAEDLDGLFGLLVSLAWMFELGSVAALMFTVPGSFLALIVWFLATATGGISGYLVAELLPIQKDEGRKR